MQHMWPTTEAQNIPEITRTENSSPSARENKQLLRTVAL